MELNNSIVKKYIEDNPDLAGANLNDVLLAFHSQHGRGAPIDLFVKQLEKNGGPIFAPEFREATRVERLGRGMMDFAQGAKQLYLHATDEEAAQEYDKSVKQELSQYRKGVDDSVDWWRIGGNVVSAIPLALIPGGQSLAAQSATGAAMGAAGAGAMLTEGEDFWTDKLMQTGLGGFLGLAGPSAIAGVKYASQNWLTEPAKKAWFRLFDGGRTQLMDQLESAVVKAGVKWDELTSEVRASLLNDGLEQLTKNGELSPDALVRKARLEKLGYNPTAGQVTREPKQWQFERNMSKTDDGEGLMRRFSEQNEQMMTAADALVSRFGINGIDDYTASKGVRDAGQELAAKSQKMVGSKYDEIVDAPLDWEGLHWSLKSVLSDWDDQITGVIRNRVDDLISGKVPPTTENVVKALKLVNKRTPLEPDQRAALGATREALHLSLTEAMAQGGKASASVKEATEIAARRFGFMRGSGKSKTSFVTDLLDNKSSLDNFINRVSSGETDDIYHLRRFLLEMPDAFGLEPESAKQAWLAVRGRVLAKVNEKAGFGDPSKNAFNGKQWRKAWEKLGARRDALFTQQERDVIDEMVLAAEDLTTEVPYSAPNYSNTGAFLYNLGNRVSAFPVLGDMFSMLIAGSRMGKDALASEVKRRQAANALSGRSLPRPTIGGLEATPAAATAPLLSRE